MTDQTHQDSSDGQDDAYEVGYCRPPKETQFKPGQSGNPKGRPKQTKDLQKLFERELDKKVRISEGGCVKTLTFAEVFVKSVVKDGVEGKRDARKLLWEIMNKRVDMEEIEVDDAAENMLQDLIDGGMLKEGSEDGYESQGD